MAEKEEIPTPEKPPMTGELDQDLKAAREARGLSLSDIFKETRVSLTNLQALEDGNYKALPPPVYTRNFIRKYARAVGADEKPLLKRYEKYIEGQNPPREDPGVQKPWPETGRRYRFLFGSLAIVIVAGILVYALFLYDQSGRAIRPAQSIESPPAEQMKPAPEVPVIPPIPAASVVPPVPAPTTVKEPAPAAGKAAVPTSAATTAAPVPATAAGPARPAGKAAPPSAVTTAAPAPAAGPPRVAETPAIQPPMPASGKTLNLVIEARELTWLRITEDRNPSSQVLLKPGEKIDRRASNSFLLDIGNAAGVNLIFDGKPLGVLGNQGQVIHMQLPAQAPEKRTP
jgi:cytoskeleton protein RodZ